MNKIIKYSLIAIVALTVGTHFLGSSKSQPEKQLSAEQIQTIRDHANAEQKKSVDFRVDSENLVNAVTKLDGDLKDPQSFRLQQAMVYRNGEDRTVCIAYHATNSFGANIQGHFVWVFNAKKNRTTYSNDVSSDWNTKCKGEEHDYTAILHEQLKGGKTADARN